MKFRIIFSLFYSSSLVFYSLFACPLAERCWQLQGLDGTAIALLDLRQVDVKWNSFFNGTASAAVDIGDVVQTTRETKNKKANDIFWLGCPTNAPCPKVRLTCCLAGERFPKALAPLGEVATKRPTALSISATMVNEEREREKKRKKGRAFFFCFCEGEVC